MEIIGFSGYSAQTLYALSLFQGFSHKKYLVTHVDLKSKLLSLFLSAAFYFQLFPLSYTKASAPGRLRDFFSVLREDDFYGLGIR
jgi:hypothetical protein